MCGRYTLTVDSKIIGERFHVTLDERDFKPRFNVAPGQECPIIAVAPERRLLFWHWGMTPRWWKYKSRSLINVREESMVKPVFRRQFEKNRCLVVADGFYEWRKDGKTKVPYRFTAADGGPFAMAGVWEEETRAEGGSSVTFAIVTTSADKLMAPIHDRMPCVLRPEAEDVWLDPATPLARLTEILRPAPIGRLRLYEVSRAINNPKAESADLIKPVWTPLSPTGRE